MALVKKDVYKGIPIESSYHKVTQVSLDLLNNTAKVQVSVYLNEQERIDNPRSPIYTEDYTCYAENPDGTTFNDFFNKPSEQMIPAESAYHFLKSRKEYESALDA